VFLNEKYRNPNLWAHVWIAGSGVSYQWSAARQPGDLDVLIGVNYIQFRRAHPEFKGLGDVEISRMLNEDFRTHLQPKTQDWNGYEVGYDEIEVVGLYSLIDMPISIYVDASTGRILEAWLSDDEDPFRIGVV
jgi:hypothetical protein